MAGSAAANSGRCPRNNITAAAVTVAATSRCVARLRNAGQVPPEMSPVSTKSHEPSRTNSANVTRVSGRYGSFDT